MTELQRCIEVVRRLRDPDGGCPWDLEQTHQTLLKYLLEESYEYIDAVENDDAVHMREELGDVLLQVLLHARIAEQGQSFTLEDVARELANKLVRRHPHVFAPKDEAALTPEEVRTRWEAQKKVERSGRPTSKIPDKLMHHPALKTAHLIGEASAKIAFDWTDHRQVASKVEEEWQELKDELPPGGHFNKARVAEEMGDLLFSVAQLARHLGLDPEEALRQGNRKFLRRFHTLEQLAADDGADVGVLDAAAMERYWARAKEQLK